MLSGVPHLNPSKCDSICIHLPWFSIRPTIINSLFPVLVREKYHGGGYYYFVKSYYHIKDKCYIYSWAYKCIKHTHIATSMFFAGLFTLSTLNVCNRLSSSYYVYNRLSRTWVINVSRASPMGTYIRMSWFYSRGCMGNVN